MNDIDLESLTARAFHDVEGETIPAPEITHEGTTWGEYLWINGRALAHNYHRGWFTWKSSNENFETIQQIDDAIALLQEARRLMIERGAK